MDYVHDTHGTSIGVTNVRMASAIQEKPSRTMDLETGSRSSGLSDKKKSDASGPHEDNRTMSSLAREEGEEINYHTLTWW